MSHDNAEPINTAGILIAIIKVSDAVISSKRTISFSYLETMASLVCPNWALVQNLYNWRSSQFDSVDGRLEGRLNVVALHSAEPASGQSRQFVGLDNR